MNSASTGNEPLKHRGVLVLGIIALLAVILAAVIGLRVQRSFAPGSEDIPVATRGVPELDTEVLISGLDHVWDVGFLPDETLIFTERSGTISKLVSGRKVELLSVPNIRASGEGGLSGLVVDPDFEQNRYIYACYNTEQDVRVSRWRVNEEATTLSEQTDIVTGMPSIASGRHSGCRPRFGADGNLWIGTGDAATGTNPQNPRSLGGKVLRVDRSGNPASGNLGGEFDPRIYSYGHRNVQGLAMFEKEQDGSFGFSVEHGPRVDDEVNRLVSGNKGWNPVPGYNESVPMTDKDKYPDAIEAVWSSGDSTIAPSGGTIITGDRWGSLEGRLAMAVLKDQHVRLLEFDSKGVLMSEETLFLREFGRLRSVVMGIDNNMYLTTDNGDNQDRIIRVSPR